jgi:hypothetical protein
MGIETAAAKGAETAGKTAGNSGNPSGQATDSSGNKKEEPKVYTEAQFQEKLKEAQQSIRKGETKRVEGLQAEVATLKTSLETAEGQIEDQTVLKAQIKKLHEEIEGGIPDEGKDAINKYLKKLADLTEAETRGMKGLKKMDDELKTYKKTDLQSLIDGVLSDPAFTGDKDELQRLGSKEAIKVYAYDHRDPTKAKTPDKAADAKGDGTETATVDQKTLPGPDEPVGHAGGSFKTEQQALDERYPTMAKQK